MCRNYMAGVVDDVYREINGLCLCIKMGSIQTGEACTDVAHSSTAGFSSAHSSPAHGYLHRYVNRVPTSSSTHSSPAHSYLHRYVNRIPTSSSTHSSPAHGYLHRYVNRIPTSSSTHSRLVLHTATCTGMSTGFPPRHPHTLD